MAARERDLWVGIDLGGTKLVLVLATRDGTPIQQVRRPTEPCGDPEADVSRILGDVKQLVADAGRRVDEIARVGVCVPGPVDLEQGAVIDPPNLPGWKRVLVGRRIREVLGCSVAMDNDANAAALAEWRYGAGRGARHLVYLTMSTGVGAGLILDGRIYRGHGFQAGELGHVPVEWDGEPCACGERGCLEAYVGGAAWTQRLRAQAPRDGRVVELAGAADRVTPEHVVEAAREADPYALSELDRFNRYLARGVVATAFALAPERIILGTIPTAAGEILCLQPVRDRVAERLWSTIDAGLEIVASQLGHELPMYAAICAAREGVEVAAEPR